MNEQEIMDLYELQYGKLDPKSGFRIKISKSKKGNWMVNKYYQRSSWSDEELEHTTVYSPDGKLIEHK